MRTCGLANPNCVAVSGHPGERHPDWSMERTLQATQASLKAQGVPIAYYQLDDWWFQQTGGDFGGMKEWRPCHQEVNGSASYCSTPTARQADSGSDQATLGAGPVNVFVRASKSTRSTEPMTHRTNSVTFALPNRK